MRRLARTARRSLLGVLCAGGALVAAGLPATAADSAAAPSAERRPAVHAAAGSAAEHARISDFWTPDRMRQAEPLDLLAADPAETRPAVPRKGVDRAEGERADGGRAGRPSTVAPVAPAAFPDGGGPWTGGGKVVSTAGRVFFTYQGRTASCSGNAVTSQNGRTVLTAGHCVKLEGAWHTNWTFVPGYHDGQAPHGKWTAARTLATPQWAASEDMNYDVGAAVVAPLDGKRLTDVVGGQGLAFNSGYNKAMYAFGFPAADPYDGEKFIYCSGTAFRDFLLTDDHGLSCDMTGGSSGGPWFTQFDEATGTGLQSSVNSFKYTFLPGAMFGPYFGDDAKNLYEQAQSAS